MALDYDGVSDIPSAIGLSGPGHRTGRKNADGEVVKAVQQAVNVVKLTSKHYRAKRTFVRYYRTRYADHSHTPL